VKAAESGVAWGSGLLSEKGGLGQRLLQEPQFPIFVPTPVPLGNVRSLCGQLELQLAGGIAIILIQESGSISPSCMYWAFLIRTRFPFISWSVLWQLRILLYSSVMDFSFAISYPYCFLHGRCGHIRDKILISAGQVEQLIRPQITTAVASSALQYLL